MPFIVSVLTSQKAGNGEKTIDFNVNLKMLEIVCNIL